MTHRNCSKPKIIFAVPDCAELYQNDIVDRPAAVKKQIFLLASNNEVLILNRYATLIFLVRYTMKKQSSSQYKIETHSVGMHRDLLD